MTVDQPNPVVIKKGDLLPVLRAQLMDINGTIQPLTGATVKFYMRKRGTTAPVRSGDCIIDDADEGRVIYEWQDGDTDEVGLFEGEFEADFSGKKETFPNGEHLRIRVVEQIGPTA